MVTKKNNLKEYKSKRHFNQTPEPKGRVANKSKKLPIFVIHKHDARALHYDLRLEAEGVLKSWAIPKGPSTNPNEKHLAVMVEDHPYDYAKFEGNIPEGQYGAGGVIIWDKGTYKNLRSISIADSIDDGKLVFKLNGKKLKGAYVLVKTNFKPNSWLFFKMKDDDADSSRDITREKPKSVVSRKTVEQIEKDKKSKKWISNK